MSIAREFLDWQTPPLESTVRYLVRSYAGDGHLDLGRLLLVFPVRRAGRRLLERLALEADDRRWRLTPPRMATAGSLPELLYRPQRPFASDLVQQLAWARALRETRVGDLTAVVPHPPAAADDGGWIELASVIRHLHRELAGDQLNFADVANMDRAVMNQAAERARWQVLAQVQRDYLGLLDGLELWDRQTARRVATAEHECSSDCRILMIGTADLNRSLRAMLDHVADDVTALVFAPPDRADDFDAHGCLLPHRWKGPAVPVPAGRVHVVDGPADQATAILRVLDSYDGAYRTDEITVGAADERLVPSIERKLDAADVPARWGPGWPLSATRPMKLVEAVADFAERRDYRSFAALVRHPDMEHWIGHAGVRGDWLTRLDEHFSEHLPYRLDRTLFTGDAALCGLVDAVERLVGPVAQPARPLAETARALEHLVLEVFSTRPWDLDRPDDRRVYQALRRLMEVVRQAAEIPAELRPTLAPRAAIGLIVGPCLKEAIPPEEDPSAIEILGWLELAMDDAPALVVAGFNEGIVPSSVNSDPFLPNALRGDLGLEDNARRFARDAYALSVLVRSRADLQLIVGRRSADGDPMIPSRLLFGDEPRDTATRVVEFFGDAAGSSSGALPQPSAAHPAAADPSADPSAAAADTASLTFPFTAPRPVALEQPVESLRVTDFRLYLECPYRFYLRRIVGLETCHDQAAEMDAAQFGIVIHEVLERFGQCPESGSTDPDEIREMVEAMLVECVRARFGAEPLPAVNVQVQQIRKRLDAFARAQALWAAEGWRIKWVEAGKQAGVVPFDVDGEPIALRGRIDRIDHNVQTGQWAILDYKTGDEARTPDRTHLRRGLWIDLQLPLYRHLAHHLELDGELLLGYFLVPKDPTRAGVALASWTPDQLAVADAEAAQVVRQLRQEIFWPPAQRAVTSYVDPLAPIVEWAVMP